MYIFVYLDIMQTITRYYYDELVYQISFQMCLLREENKRKIFIIGIFLRPRHTILSQNA